MPVPIYEEQVICDNCGAVVISRVVDAARFEQDAEVIEPALLQTDEDREVVVDEGDLVGEEEESPVEILIRHVGSCGRCSGSP